MNINISKVKIITTIPSENIEEVRNAICEVGAGIIGSFIPLLDENDLMQNN